MNSLAPQAGRLVAAAWLLVVLGPLLAFLRVLPPIAGFSLLLLAGIAGIVGGVGAFGAFRREGRRSSLAVLALGALPALGLLGLAASNGAPPINDISTDLEQPPALRAASALPRHGGEALPYPEAWRDVVRKHYPDLAPLETSAPPATVFVAALRLAEARPGWTVHYRDAAEGRISAFAETGLFRFVDDIEVRIRPAGEGSRVDMRSRSRDGRGDFGANAARIRAFLADLEAEPAGG